MNCQIAQPITKFSHIHIQPSFIIMFGSFAKENPDQESDINIGFDVKY